MKIHKRYHKHINHLKHIFIFLGLGLVSFIAILYFGNVYYEKINPTAEHAKLGVTFSTTFAKYLLPDWKQTYVQMFDDLDVKYLRIPVYWQEVEKSPGVFDFSDIDFMLDEAEKRDAKVILAVGIKLPRWPECHIPDWAKELTVEQRQQQALVYITAVMEKYKDNPTLYAWQVENEPLLAFGSEICDKPDREFLKKEAQLAKKIDPNHPIILTDSGELRMWVTPMKLSDILGTTLYRSVYNPLFGYLYYPLPPAFYNFKASFIKKWFAPENQKTIIVELQTEPWAPQGIPASPFAQQISVFTLDDFKNNVVFAKRTGFDEIYLWGVEWWYYMSQHGHPEYLEYAKTLFKK